MNDPLLIQIENSLERQSKGDRAISEYILKNYDKVGYMTVGDVSDATGVSEATVVRYARKMGCEGFPQLRQALQEAARSRMTIDERMRLSAERIGGSDVLTVVMNNDIEMIRRTTEQADREQFSSAVDALCAARHIYVVGTRSAAALASFMAHYLSMIFESVTIVDPSNESGLFEQMLHVGNEDVCIGISFPRYSKKALKAMRFATDCGAKRIAITDSESSPMAKYADYLLLAQSDMASIVDSLVAPFSLVNALLVAAADRRRSELTERFQRLERIWDEYDVYEKTE